MKNLLTSISVAFLSVSASAAVFELKMLPGESWWGGQVTDGEKMPWGLALRKLHYFAGKLLNICK
jgi:hypothetical protein